MRDELDGRIWTAYHDDFSRFLGDVGASVAAAGRGLARNAYAGRQLVAGLGALAAAALTFGSAVA